MYLVLVVYQILKVSIFLSTTVAVTRLESFPEVGSLDLTW